MLSESFESLNMNCDLTKTCRENLSRNTLTFLVKYINYKKVKNKTFSTLVQITRRIAKHSEIIILIGFFFENIIKE